MRERMTWLRALRAYPEPLSPGFVDARTASNRGSVMPIPVRHSPVALANWRTVAHTAWRHRFEASRADVSTWHGSTRQRQAHTSAIEARATLGSTRPFCNAKQGRYVLT